MNLTIETEQEDDGQLDRGGAGAGGRAGLRPFTSGGDGESAGAALRVLAEQLEHGEARAVDLSVSVAAE